MNTKIKFGAIALSAALLAACGSNNSPTPVVQDAQFEVRLVNLTNGQAMSPVAMIMHNTGFNNFVDGETASIAVEILAEGGSNAQVLSEAQAATAHIASASTTGPVPPGTSSTTLGFAIPTAQVSDLRLSVMTMLIRTNDSFTGLNATNISDMAVGSTRAFTTTTWDAGTEADIETAVSMPGTGGEGFNATRDDRINLVRVHNGVVTNASAEFGLPTSALVEADRFLNPTSRIVVTRTQ